MAQKVGGDVKYISDALSSIQVSCIGFAASVYGGDLDANLFHKWKKMWRILKGMVRVGQKFKGKPEVR